jgi:hypothetical protein
MPTPTPAGPEVLDRLHAIDVAIDGGVDRHHPAIDRLRQWARWRAEVELAETAHEQTARTR